MVQQKPWVLLSQADQFCLETLFLSLRLKVKLPALIKWRCSHSNVEYKSEEEILLKLMPKQAKSLILANLGLLCSAVLAAPQCLAQYDYGQGYGQGNAQQYSNFSAPQTAFPSSPRAAPLSPEDGALIYDWFVKYGEIRRQAQMNPIEKQQADQLMSQGLSIFMPGEKKAAARELLSRLVARYGTATQSLQSLPTVPQTMRLQQAYFQYFDTAGRLFADYVRVQDNVLAKDPQTGQPLAAQLMTRKLQLEQLEHGCKQLDAQLRMNFGIPPFQ